MQEVVETGGWRGRTEGSVWRGIVLISVALVLVALYVFRARLPVAEWYSFLSLPTSVLSEPVGDFADRVNIPLLSALLFGLMGALSPCQLSTNLAAFAYTTRRVDRPALVAASAAAYIAGKILVYTLIGLAAIVVGIQLQQASIPVIVAARKVLGPALLLLGLVLLGVVRFSLSVGGALSAWFEQQAEGRGILGAFLMGVAFAFAFCPTLFLLFFGLTLPLAIASPIGPLYPGVFALGTALPLLLFLVLASAASVSVGSFRRRARGVSLQLNRVVGVVFILVGLNEIVLYWLS